MQQNTNLKTFSEALKKAAFGECKEGHCVKCKESFSDKNVFTAAGWRETKLSGMCEKCWDEVFAEEDDG